MYRGTEDKLSLQSEFNIASSGGRGAAEGKSTMELFVLFLLLNAVTVQT